jgi:hypothetical protein
MEFLYNDFCNAVKKCETKTTLVNNANGTYQYVNEGGTISVLGYNLTCVNDSTIQLRDNDGTLVTTCVLRGAATPPVPIAVDTLIVQADSTLTVQTTDGNQYTLDLCDIVKKCETNIIVLNNIDGTYTIVNENGFPTVLGYRLQCVNDSTIAITDNDGTLINQCMLKGGANPSVPIAIDTLIIASDSTVTVRTTDGNEYTLDLCNVVKKCETAPQISFGIQPQTNTIIQTKKEILIQSLFRLDGIQLVKKFSISITMETLRRKLAHVI